MITLPPYIIDRVAYEQVPDEHRWIFDKLEICSRFGYEPAGACGEPMPAGLFCIRPQVNLHGMAKGGFWRHRATEGEVVNRDGYCWTVWETGLRSWVEYLNDEVSSANIQTAWDGECEEYAEQPRDDAHPLPDQLRNISRYMMVEYLGDVVIDIGPRHMVEEPKESVLEDYRQFDPSYDYQGDDAPGTIQQFMRRAPHRDGSYSWEEVRTTLDRSIYA